MKQEMSILRSSEQQQELTRSEQLLEAIANAQSTFITEQDRRKAFDTFLTDILQLTQSEYGFIGEIIYNDDNQPYLKTYAITNIAWNDETREFYQENAPHGMEFSNLDTLFGAVLTSQQPVISNQPADDPRAGGLPEGHPALHAFMGLPVFHADKAVAMLGIANRSTGYDMELAEFLNPLLVTIGQLVEAHRVQHQHLENERRLKATIEGTNIGTWEWNVQTGETVFNEEWARIAGYTLDELEPISIQTWQDIAHPDDLDSSGRELGRHFAGECEYYDVKCRMKHKDGHWVWVHDRGRVFSWTAEGKPLMMYGTHADITKEKQSEAALRESESRLRGLFELSPVGIALNDSETGHFIEVNDALIRPTGYTREEFLALSYWDITPRLYEKEEARQLELLNTTGRYGPYEKEYIRKDGEKYPVLLSGMLITDQTGKQMIWSIVEDITERKRIDQMKNEFVSTVSHELRTPLTSISGALGLMKGGAIGKLPEKARQMINVAHNNSLILTSIINDLLDMEKLVAGKMQFNMRILDVVPIVEQTIVNNQAYAAENNVAIRLDKQTDSTFTNVDPDRLIQVLANLISNAVKFSPENEIVTIKISPRDETIRIEVIDNGPGISNDFRKHLFKKFAREDSSDARTKGGTGLGLAISREFIERMSGQIGYDSVHGTGSKFWIELPFLKNN